jgi:hypothetical protein
MNLKEAKLLRKTAMSMSLPGEPKSQLVMSKQQCNPWYNSVTKKTETRTAYCAVNNPHSFRGRYRNLKSGRSIDVRRIEAAGRDIEAMKAMHTTTSTRSPVVTAIERKSAFAVLREKVNKIVKRMFRHQHR